MNDFKVLLRAVLDSNSVGRSDIEKIQNVVNKYHVNLTADLDKASMLAEIKKIVPQLEAEIKKASNIDIKISDSSILKSINQINSEIEKVTSKANKIQLSVDTNQTVSQYQSLIAKTQQWTDANGEALISTSNLATAVKNLNVASQEYGGNKSVENAQKLTSAYETFNKEIKTVTNSVSLMNNRLAKDSEITRLTQQIQEFKDKNPKALKTFGGSIDEVFNKLKSGASITNKELQDMKQQFVGIQNEARQTGKLGNTFFGSIKENLKSFIPWVGGTGALMGVTHSIKNALSELKDVDTLLTEISKANDKLSKQDLSNIGTGSFDVASKFGKKATDYLAGVQEMSRVGYENADIMAELSTAVQGAGDMTSELAISYIIATDKAYEMNGSVDALTRTLDGANKITNENAVNMTELAEGMKVVGSQAASSQMSVEETTAAIGTLVAVTQQSGSQMGNAFKGILMNLRQVTGEVEDGEDAIDESSLTKYEKACEKLGVSLSTVKDGIVSLKDPMQILKELSVEYKKLDESDARRANLLSSVGGKYRSNALNAILENYDLYEKMLKDYANGEGSMAKEAEKTANSWEGSMNRMANSYTKLIDTLANQDAIIGTINGFSKILGVVSDVTNSLGVLPTLGIGLGGILGGKNLLAVKNIDGELKFFNKTIISTKDNLSKLNNVTSTFAHNKNGVFDLSNLKVEASKSVGSFTKLNNAFNAYNNNLSKSTQLQTAYVKAVGNQNTSLGNYLSGLNGAKASMGGYVKSLVGAKAATIGLQAASVALNMALSMGLSLAISAIVSGITKWVNKEKEVRENAIETAKLAKEESENLSGLLDKYNQLSEEVKTNSDAKDSLIDTQNELLKALGIEQSELDSLIDKYGSLSKAINQVTLDSLKEAHGELLTGYNAYKEDLIKAGGDGFWGGKNIIDASGKSAVKAFGALESRGIIDSSSYGSSGGALVLIGDDSTVEGILDNYNKLKEAQNALNEAISDSEFTEEEMSSNPLYNAIQSRINELKQYVDNYKSAISDVNSNSASQQIIYSLMGKELPKTEEEFETFKDSVIAAAKASNNFIGSQEDIESAVINTLSNMPEFSQYFIEVEEAEESVAKKIKDLAFSLSEESSKSIDDFQSKMKSLATALSSLREGKLSPDEKMDLLQDFPELEGKTDDLESAIKTLADTLLNELLANFDNPPTELVDMLTGIKDEAITATEKVTSLGDAFADMSKKAQLLQQIKSDISETGKISNSTLQSIASTFPKLEKVIAKYQAGLISDIELFDALKSTYSDDANNYAKLLSSKLSDDKEFYTQICNNSSKYFETIKQYYGKDVNNWRTVAQAKAGIESELMKKLSEKWNEYFSAVYDKEANLYKLTGGANYSSKVTGANGNTYDLNNVPEFVREQYNKAEKEALEAIRNANNALSEMDTSIKLELGDFSFDGGIFDKDDKGKKDTKDTFDFIENKLDNMNDALKKQKELADDSAKSFKEQKQAIQDTISLIDKQIPKYEKASQEYLAKANAVGLSSSLRNKVINGSYDITEYDSNTSDKIKEFDKWYTEYKNTISTIESLQSDKNSYTLKLGELIPTNEIDFAEIKMNKLADALDKQKEKAESLYSTYKEQNKELSKTLKLIESQEKDYQEIYEFYTGKASDVGLSKKLRNKVDNGTINIGLYDDETSEKIKLYKEYAKSANDAKDAIDGLNKAESESKRQKIDNIADDFNRRIDYQKSLLSIIENDIEYRKSLGEAISENDYNTTIAQQERIKSIIQNEHALIQKKVDTLVKIGEIAVGDDEWYEYQKMLVGFELDIQDIDSSIQSMGDSINNLKFEKFEKAFKAVENLKKETNDLLGLLNKNNFVDKSGNYTKDGLTAISLYGKQISANTALMSEYDEAIASLDKSQSDYADKLEEYRSAQRSLSGEIKSYNDSILDIYIESINAQTEARVKNNQATIDELIAQRELHNEQRKEKQNAKELVQLQTRISNLEDSDKREDKAMVIRLKEELYKKEQDLEEKRYQSSVQNQIDALEEQNSDYKDAQNEKIDTLKRSTDEQEKVISSMLSNVQSNTDSVLSNITTIANQYGVTLSDNLTSPWTNAIKEAQRYKEVMNSITSQPNSSNLSKPTTPVTSGNSSKTAQILSVLNNGNGQGAGTSELNKYITGKYGHQISYSQMAQLANLFGIDGVTASSIVKDTITKNLILEKLKKAGFSSGGRVMNGSSNSINSLLRKNGDNTIISAKVGEVVATEKAFDKLLDFDKIIIPKMTNITSNLERMIPNAKNGKTPEIKIMGNLLNVEGNFDDTILDKTRDMLQDAVPNIVGNYWAMNR